VEKEKIRIHKSESSRSVSVNVLAVFLEILLELESPIALVALERRVVAMRLHVGAHIALVGERCVA